MRKLDPQARQQIAMYIRDIIGKLENPKAIAKPLVGRFKGYHRFRVNCYRIICQIIDSEITIILIEVGHRREVYNVLDDKKLERLVEMVTEKFE
jgi:mRNA interferase RelE/StbE